MPNFDYQNLLPDQIGKYQVERMIGHGAIGVVFLGTDDQIGRSVAIKTLRPDIIANLEDREGLLKRFATEARSAGRCQHPNIVTIYDYLEIDGAPYLIMEYVKAGTLESAIKSGARIPNIQVNEIMVQLLYALQHAHEKGVIHRDIKPANILCPSATSIKVTDFGVARFGNLGLTAKGGIAAIGTPNYMSPEQFLGRPVDARSDLYSAAILMFELLTGRKPFVASEIPELMQKLLNETPPLLSSIRPGLGNKLDLFMARALARNPDDRFPNAEAFLHHLNASFDLLAGDETQRLDLSKITATPIPSANSKSGSELSQTMAEKLLPATLATMELELTRSIGPIAKVVLTKTARTVTDAEQLLTVLCDTIPGEEDSRRFRNEAERTLRQDSRLASAQLDAAIPTADIEWATAALTPFIGPVAAIVVKKRAETSIGVEDFYQRLAQTIPSPNDREKFLSSRK